MNYMSSIVDKNQHGRVENSEFLFMTAPSVEGKDEIYGIGMGDQIKELKNLFSKNSNMEISRSSETI